MKKKRIDIVVLDMPLLDTRRGKEKELRPPNCGVCNVSRATFYRRIKEL